MIIDCTDLSSEFGERAARQLATAYEAALFALSVGDWRRMPDRATRLRLVDGMIAEGRLNGFASDRLRRAGLAAVGARDAAPDPRDVPASPRRGMDRAARAARLDSGRRRYESGFARLENGLTFVNAEPCGLVDHAAPDWGSTS